MATNDITVESCLEALRLHDERMKEMRADLDHARGHPAATWCGICDRPLLRCECDELLAELEAENARLREENAQLLGFDDAEDQARYEKKMSGGGVSELKPCPFCGEVPDFPHGFGTQYEIECECGMAMSSVQICDLMTMDERNRPDAWSGENICYAPGFVERAKREAVARWNERAMLAVAREAAAEGRSVMDEHESAYDCLDTLRAYIHMLENERDRTDKDFKELEADRERLEFAFKWGGSFNFSNAGRSLTLSKINGGEFEFTVVVEDSEGEPHWVTFPASKEHWRDAIDEALSQAAGGHIDREGE
jgi:hypothetical protein